MGKARITPGKLPATQARVGMVVVALMLVFGVVFGITAITSVPDSEGVLRILVGLFFLIWITACVTILRCFARVARGGRSGQDRESLLEVEYQDDHKAPKAPDFDLRLRKLEELRREGLVTEAEYQAKRKEILSQPW